MTNHRWHSIEQDAGPAGVDPVDPEIVEARRRRTYESFERFLRARLAEQDRLRTENWRRDYSSIEAYKRSVEPMRDRLKQAFGFWAEPADRPPLRCGDEEVLREDEKFTAIRYDLEVFPEATSYAVELIPRTTGPRPALLLQHGYGGTPELICGLASVANREDYSYRSLGLRAVSRGYHVLAVHHPYGYGSLAEEHFGLPEFPTKPGEYAKNRLHRLATLSGATSFGLDLMASSRGIDRLEHRDGVDASRIGMYGLSQGAQATLFLAAIDTRIRAAVASAFFNRRIDKLVGPCDGLSYLDSNEEDKFFARLLAMFSDADVASLIAPRAFAVEAGLKDQSVDFEKARAEFDLVKSHFERLGIGGRAEFIPHQAGHISATARAFEFLDQEL